MQVWEAQELDTDSCKEGVLGTFLMISYLTGRVLIAEGRMDTSVIISRGVIMGVGKYSLFDT